MLALLDDASDQTGGNGLATLADVDALASLDSDGVVQGGKHLDVVTRHDHLGAGVLGTLGEEEGAGLVGGADEHLGAVVLVETSVAATLVLGQDVEGDEELGVSSDGAGLDNDHAALDVLTADTTEQETRVVTSTGLLARLLEGLNVGDLGLDNIATLADKLDLGILLEDTTLDTAGSNGTTAGDGEDILNGHQERLVQVADGGRDPLVNSLEKLVNFLLANLGALVLEGAEGGAHDDRALVAVEAVRAQQLTHLHLDELQHLGILESIDLVDEDDNPLDTDLTGEQQVLTGLAHLTVRGGDDNDGAVHVGGTSDHVLDVILVAGAVDVGVVPLVGRVLDVRRGDGDTTFPLLRSLVDGAIVEEAGQALLGLPLGDGGGQSRLCRWPSVSRV